MKTFHVLVPKAGTVPAQWIKPGSGIVTDDLSDDGLIPGRIKVYFEGNLYGHPGISFEEKVNSAAARCSERYPTIACGVWPRSDFEVIGTYTCSDDWKDRSLEIDRQSVLQPWLETHVQEA